MEINEVIADLIRQHPDRLIFSAPRNKNKAACRKAMVRPVIIRGEEMWQVERMVGKQAFHQNVSSEELGDTLTGLTEEFTHMDGWSQSYTSMLIISQKGKILFRKKPTLEAGESNRTDHEVQTQNRDKKYLLEAKDAPAPLVELGVVSREGKVIAQKYDKYKQINRFVEMIDGGIGPEVTRLNIIDFGCGKSYLTFVLYDYLTRVRKLEAHVVGLDLKETVIRDCEALARKFGYDGLHFEVGDINGYQPDFPVDMVISLHACDTATDFALFNAVSWHTPRIFSVPCCQHEINHQIDRHSVGSLSEYGLIKERFSALLTDAIRADILRAQGYKTDVLEFVDMQHSPKNILIRAVKTEGGSSGHKAEAEAAARVRAAVEEYRISPTLYKLLMEERPEDETETV